MIPKHLILWIFILGFVLVLYGCDENQDKTETIDPVIYLGVISDIHLQEDDTANANEKFRLAGSILNDFTPDLSFVVNTGDNLHYLEAIDEVEESRDFLIQYKNMIEETFNIPYYFVLGNHDYYMKNGWNMNVNPRDTEALWKDAFADSASFPDLYFAIDFNGYTFLFLNSMETSVDLISSWKGGFSQPQIEWIEAQLSRGRPSVLFFHNLLQTEVFLPSEPSYFFIPLDDPIYSVIEEYQSVIQGIFMGHGHKFIRDYLHDIPLFETHSLQYSEYYFHIVELHYYEKTLSIHNDSSIHYHYEP